MGAHDFFFAFLDELGDLEHNFFFLVFGHFNLKTLRIFSEFTTVVPLGVLAVSWLFARYFHIKS